MTLQEVDDLVAHRAVLVAVIGAGGEEQLPCAEEARRVNVLLFHAIARSRRKFRHGVKVERDFVTGAPPLRVRPSKVIRAQRAGLGFMTNSLDWKLSVVVINRRADREPDPCGDYRGDAQVDQCHRGYVAAVDDTGLLWLCEKLIPFDNEVEESNPDRWRNRRAVVRSAVVQGDVLANVGVGISMGCGNRFEDRDGQGGNYGGKQLGHQKFSSYSQFPGIRISVTTCRAC